METGRTIQGGMKQSQISLRLLSCAQCGIAYAVPADFHITRGARQEPIHCPAGHANDPGEQTPASMLLEDLTHARAEMERLGAELQQLRARLGESSSIDNKELRRRANLLAATAERSGRGIMDEPICPVCGRTKAGANRLAEHIYRQHREQIRQMPATKFN